MKHIKIGHITTDNEEIRISRTLFLLDDEDQNKEYHIILKELLHTAEKVEYPPGPSEWIETKKIRFYTVKTHDGSTIKCDFASLAEALSHLGYK